MKKLHGLLYWMRWLALTCLLAGAASSSLAAKTYSDNGDGTVTDPTTGLTWMRCSMGQTWDGTTCTGTTSIYTWDLAKALTGTVTFAGQGDWRLPNIRELQTIVDRSVYNLAIHSGTFPNTPNSFFWSSSPIVNNPYHSWGVDFVGGKDDTRYRGDYYSVRLVRGGQSSGLFDIARPSTDYVDQGDGTVTHTPTRLTWQRCAVGQSWTGSTCQSGYGLFLWKDAKLLRSSLAGKTDWRLPTEEELVSLVDYGKSRPAINATLFPDTPSTGFWSSSPSAVGSGVLAWFVSFGGGSGQLYREELFNVRLVRGGQCFGPLALTASKSGTGQIASSVGTGTGTSTQCSTGASGYYAGDVVTLTASPVANLISWSGACASARTASTCTVTMDAAKTVTASFIDTPVVTGLPAALIFTTRNIASTSAPQTLTLTNTGTASLNIRSITASADFAVTNNCGAGIGAGGFCTLNVSFTPSASGTRAGTLTLTTDAPGSPHSIALTGSGQGALATLSAYSKTFTSQKMGSTSAAQTITLSNTGGVVLNISSIVASGDFAKATTCGATLAKAATCVISVTFTPTAIGVLNGSVVITSDAASSPSTISLSGTGLAGPVLSLSLTSLSFNATTAGSSTAVQSISLTNTSTVPLSLTSITASGDFMVTHNCGSGLGASGYCNLSVTFTPTATGNRVGAITIMSNAPGSPHSISLSGGVQAGTTTITLSTGWNLLGNGVNAPLDVTTLVDASKVTSVWKWVSTGGGKWAFYSPSLAVQALKDYATSMGYDVLTSINAGEGYWVNANTAFTIQLPVGTAVTSTSLQSLSPGWQLFATGDTKTPSGFNAALSTTPPASGVVPQNFASLWAWDNATSKWYFYAPSLEAQGGTALSDYITRHGYLDFKSANKTLEPRVGFWVHKQ